MIMASCPADPIHDGHIDYLEHASTLAQDLVVVVNGNDFLIRKKGYYALDEQARARVVAALGCVDYVLIWHSDNQFVDGAIRLVRPNFFASFRPYEIIIPEGQERGEDGTPECEIKACQDVGCKIIYGVGGPKKNSSSDIAKRICSQVTK